VLKNNKFNPTSNNSKMYEIELNSTSKIALLKASEDVSRDLQKFDYIFDCMKKNGVKYNENIRSRVFEYAVLNSSMDLANSMLKTLGEGSIGNTPIQPEYLKMYFEKCLKRDNFDGIAYLTNYCEKHEVNTGSWDIGSFRPALNYYLNVNYNVGKVMVFTKFYTNFYKDRKKYYFNSKKS